VAKAVKDYNDRRNSEMPYLTMGDLAILIYEDLPIKDIAKKQKFSRKFTPQCKYEFTLTEIVNICKLLHIDIHSFMSKYSKVVYR
jgi:hypothetical protein